MFAQEKGQDKAASKLVAFEGQYKFSLRHGHNGNKPYATEANRSLRLDGHSVPAPSCYLVPKNAAVERGLVLVGQKAKADSRLPHPEESPADHDFFFTLSASSSCRGPSERRCRVDVNTQPLTVICLSLCGTRAVLICNPQVLSNDAATARIGKQDTIVAYHIPEMNGNTPEKGGCTSTHARTHARIGAGTLAVLRARMSPRQLPVQLRCARAAALVASATGTRFGCTFKSRGKIYEWSSICDPFFHFVVQ